MDRLVVESSDGTPLAVRTSGAGSPLVLVHGTTGGIDSFALIEPLLAERHRVLVYDRRGRGGSGDGCSYDFCREVDDLAAVVRAAGSTPHVFGHSFGGVCALAAAARGIPMRSLTVYEPPLRTAAVPKEHWASALAPVTAGDLDEALERFFVLAGIAPHEAETMRGIPAVWQALRSGVLRAPREIEALYGWAEAYPALHVVSAPTLVISGAATGAPIYATPTNLGAIPDLDSATIESQRHLAFAFAPRTFVEIVTAFVDSHDS